MMEQRVLGRSGIAVSPLCFGTLTVGPLQANLPVREGARILLHAFNQGVNFMDTAELYANYPILRAALDEWQGTDIVVAAKAYAYTYDGMKESVERACRELGRDYIDIFLLHEQESAATFRGHAEAFDFLRHARREGLVRAIGISTHYVNMVRHATEIEDVDVIHPIFNRAGIGILDGTPADMEQAITAAAAGGKGIYSMKALGGGHLWQQPVESLRWVLEHASIDAVAVGMRSCAEVDFNIAVFQGRPCSEEIAAALKAQQRAVVIEEWCTACGRCACACPSGAIKVTDMARVDKKRCLLCGYCGAHCPDFCIKIV